MGTRANIIIKDEHSAIQLYRHWGGYPDGVIPDLKEALEFAWPRGRFEVDDFSAAIIRAWKAKGGGNIYIDGSPKEWEMVHSDTEWLYVIEKVGDKIILRVYDWHDGGGLDVFEGDFYEAIEKPGNDWENL